MNIRVGIGYDFHSFVEGRKLILGGVEIPHPRGLQGHSDADAVLHAVADALLGACGLGDIGMYFPDTESRFEGLSSAIIVEEAYRLVREKGYAVGNVDVTIICEEPRMRPHVESMRANLARLLFLQSDRIGIKATSMEGKGTIGRSEGLAAQAVALLFREDGEESQDPPPAD